MDPTMASNHGDSDGNDSLASSSSSDDEFLTLGGGSSGAGTDREALIRKKLLESFYGKTDDVDSALNGEGDKDDDDSSSSSSEGSNHKLSTPNDSSMMKSSRREGGVAKGNDDLDSPYFDADTHTSRHVTGSSVHTLLETEERLALEVRTLDSTMQTLVYENYSKFIDATDAIRSIGVSVNANEDGLARLTRGMQTIDDQSRSVEESIGSLRDAVAEKLRVKRLLTRLDTLLKLPTTLKNHVANGKYRLAAKSYLSASSILSKHSSGFESLKSIETECHAILTDMVRVLKRKVLHWSGRRDDYMDVSEGEEEDETALELGDEPVEDRPNESSSGWVPPPEPPQTVSEIFECAGTLVMVLPPEKDNNDTVVNNDIKNPASFESGLSAEDCKSMALAASLRLLERVLDSHHIEVQEAKFASTTVGAAPAAFQASALNTMASTSAEGDLKEPSRGHHLIPTSYLDSMLEAATLYGMSFCGTDGMDEDDRSRIVEFVSEAFSSFLFHVRTLLLEQCLVDETNEDDEEAEEAVEQDEGEDGASGEVSAAMTHLLHSVRDLASGLALPEVGVDVEVASSLVDQTVEVTEAMVRRRVAQQFVRLRVRVLKDCLGPFAREAVNVPADDDAEPTDTARVVQVVQMASIALSDGMQLVDDVIRSILSGGVMLGSSATSVDFSMVKEAVVSSARCFALWLASTFEVLAGCENSDPQLIVDVANALKEIETRSDDIPEEEEDIDTRRASETLLGDYGSFAYQNGESSEPVNSALNEILQELEEKSTGAVLSDLVLATAEMCRLAERNVMENINQSIASSDGVGKKSKSTGIFASAGPSQSQPGASEETNVSERFRLAASRVLALYALNRGSEAVSVGCCDMYTMASSEGDIIPSSPRTAIWQVLEIAKVTSIDCANVFGGEKRAGPVPVLSEDDVSRSPLRRNMTGSSGIGGHMSSLQLDVERMFTQKVATFPHASSVIDFSRNAVVTIMLKVAFRAMTEVARDCIFSTSGYRQLQVDMELLRCMVPHFINESFESEGSNACNVLYNLLDDVVMNAGDRCEDVECVGVEEYFDPDHGANKTPHSIIRAFMELDEGENTISRFTISEN